MLFGDVSICKATVCRADVIDSFAVYDRKILYLLGMTLERLRCFSRIEVVHVIG